MNRRMNGLFTGLAALTLFWPMTTLTVAERN